MIKNIWAGDLALIELAAGRTDAPQSVLSILAGKGHVEVTAAGPKLTGRGRRRARKLQPCAHDMRLQFAAGGSTPLATVGGGQIHG